tara:strand:- start:473 stop:640 length:168 start_codon:yes stop_codon:yes gene_type:complete
MYKVIGLIKYPSNSFILSLRTDLSVLVAEFSNSLHFGYEKNLLFIAEENNCGDSK